MPTKRAVNPTKRSREAHSDVAPEVVCASRDRQGKPAGSVLLPMPLISDADTVAFGKAGANSTKSEYPAAPVLRLVTETESERSTG